jgi:hypothetical protein
MKKYLIWVEKFEAKKRMHLEVLDVVLEIVHIAVEQALADIRV